MATRTTETLFNNSSDAAFRAWGSWFSGCFTAFGWTLAHQAFATGTDWTNVTAPAAVNTPRVTEVWAMADAGQATAPLYFKVEYGSASGGVAFPGVRISFGTGHAGSGVLTGLLYDSGAAFMGPLSNNLNTLTHYASGDAGRIVIAMGAAGTGWSNNNSVIISIERRKDGSGSSQTTGFLYAAKNGSALRHQGFLAGSAHPFLSNGWTFPCVANSGTDATFDSKVGVWPLLYCMGPSEMGLNIVAMIRANYPVGSTFTCTVLGATHTYLALQDTGMTSLFGSSIISPAIRYE